MGKKVLDLSVFLAQRLLRISVFRRGNLSIAVRRIEFVDEAIPQEFDGFTMVQISDLHNATALYYDADSSEVRNLPELISDINPDILVITGDSIDQYQPDVSAAMSVINPLLSHYPVYVVTGNHEHFSGKDVPFFTLLREAGAHLLRNATVLISKGNAKIALAGIDDPSYFSSDPEYRDELRRIHTPDAFNILLAHRPERIKDYSNEGFPLVLSGHAHGGQFRLPFIGGLYAPDQGLFPRLTSGIHRRDNTAMIVSRGLGNSRFPLRIANRPELLVITLRRND